MSNAIREKFQRVMHLIDEFAYVAGQCGVDNATIGNSNGRKAEYNQSRASIEEAIAALLTQDTAITDGAGAGAVDTGNLVSDPLYKALDALYERGHADYDRKKYDPRGTNEWQAVLDLFRLCARSSVPEWRPWQVTSIASLSEQLRKRGDDLSTDAASWLENIVARGDGNA